MRRKGYRNEGELPQLCFQQTVRERDLDVFAQWKTWYPDVHGVHLDSGVKADTRFTWTNGKARIKSTFAVVDAEREITWTGVSSGAKAVDRHVLEPIDDGGATRVFCEESMSGPLLVLFFDSAKLKAGMEEWLSALKTTAEGR